MARKSPSRTEDRVRYALWLDQDALERLRAYQVEVGVPVSESIRRAIVDYLDQLKRPKK